MNKIGSYQRLIAEDKEKISYRPTLRKIGKSISGTILLAQIFYWDKKTAEKGKDSFYKFIEPCEHPKYNKGDSWCEELNWTKKEFVGARDQFAIKITSKNKDSEEVKNALVTYKVDINRCTWWTVNRKKVNQVLEEAYTL
jgi:hypothetical protein